MRWLVGGADLNLKWVNEWLYSPIWNENCGGFVHRKTWYEYQLINNVPIRSEMSEKFANQAIFRWEACFYRNTVFFNVK